MLWHFSHRVSLLLIFSLWKLASSITNRITQLLWLTILLRDLRATRLLHLPTITEYFMGIKRSKGRTCMPAY
ncbi:hypothetical protein V8C42DRAFT_337391 [Trichoderma barbatum]